MANSGPIERNQREWNKVVEELKAIDPWSKRGKILMGEMSRAHVDIQEDMRMGR